MANVSLNLSNFKASGVYTLEYDQSENLIINSQIIRLIVGFSRKGPFNAPVYIPDKKTAERVYGKIDEFLERRGSYFHRSLYASLEYGPVFALNLMKLNDDVDFGDKVPYQSFSLATTERNGKKVYKILSSYYNKERFWFPDQQYLLGNVNTPGSPNAGKLLNIVNLGQTPVSILIRKATVLGFDVTAREWFGAGKVPAFINEWDFISDYFIEVKVVEGNWTNYDQLSIDPDFYKYFDKRGLKKSTMYDFLGNVAVNTIGEFTGCIIPDLTDGTGINHSIDTIINQRLASTGVFVAIDRAALENYDPYSNEVDTDEYAAVDMVGHNFADPNRDNPEVIDFLSYKTAIQESISFTIKSEYAPTDIFTYDYNGGDYVIKSASSHYGGKRGYLDNILQIPKPINVADDDPQLYDYDTLKNQLIAGTSLIKLNGVWELDHQYGAAGEERWGTVEQVFETTDESGKEYLNISWSHPIKTIELDMVGLNIQQLDYSTYDPANGFYNEIVIVQPDPAVPSDELDRFNAIFAPDPVGAPDTPYADNYFAGYDLLIENKTTKTYFYYKIVESEFTLADSEFGEDNPPKNFNSLRFRVLGDNTDSFKAIEKYKSQYKFYFAGDLYTVASDSLGSDYVLAGFDDSVMPEFILTPDLLKFVPADTPSETTPNLFIAQKGHKLFEYYNTGAIQNGDLIYYADPAASPNGDQDPYDYFYVTYNRDKDDENLTVLKLQMWDTKSGDDFNYNTINTIHGYEVQPINLRLKNELSTEWVARIPGALAWDSITNDMVDVIPVGVYADKLYDDIEIITNSWNSYKTKFQITVANATNVEVGDYIVSEIIDTNGDPSYMLSKIITKRKLYSEMQSGYVFEYTVNQSVKVTAGDGGTSWIVRYKPLESFIQSYQLFYLDGFKITDYHLPGGRNKKQQLWKILGMLDPQNSNLFDTLKDKNIITFRYIVDTFDGGLDPMTGPKSWLTRLAKERQKCLAIMNAPSMKEFKESNDPRFTEEPDRNNPVPILNTSYIADGGNLALGPSYTFSLPDEFWGSKFCGYFTPFITLRDGGKNINVPPAAWVANLFVQKHQSSSPWSIVAGPRRGVLSDQKLVGLEYDFLQKDREYLEPAGLNPIIKKKGVGYMIFANAMAYQKTLSAFNNLHVRDLLITIEDSIEDILSNFLFEFNDATTKLQISTIVRSYLDTVRTQGGVYDYAVIMDDTNNTPETIDQNTAIIDVAIEPVRGIHKFINRITIMKTGGISSGGFTVA